MRDVLRGARFLGAVLLLSAGVLVPAACRAGNGDLINGYPTYRERAMLALTNACRQDPVAYRDRYLGTRKILRPAAYPPVPPLYAALPFGRSARAHSADMARTPCFQHDSCDGTSLWTRIRSFGPRGTAMAENIALGYETPLEVVNGWLLDNGAADHSKGDGHRKNLMAAKYREMGNGSARGERGWYDTQDFGNGTPAFITPLVSGSHLLDPDGRITFLASWHARNGRAPLEAVLEIEDEGDVPLALAFGTAASGTWRAVLDVDDECRAYRFRFRDVAGRTWHYPEGGRLFTTGEGGCAREYASNGR